MFCLLRTLCFLPMYPIGTTLKSWLNYFLHSVVLRWFVQKYKKKRAIGGLLYYVVLCILNISPFPLESLWLEKSPKIVSPSEPTVVQWLRHIGLMVILQFHSFKNPHFTEVLHKAFGSGRVNDSLKIAYCTVLCMIT